LDGRLSSPDPTKRADVDAVAAPDQAIGSIEKDVRFFVTQQKKLCLQDVCVVTFGQVEIPESVERRFGRARIGYDAFHRSLRSLPGRVCARAGRSFLSGSFSGGVVERVGINPGI